MDNRHGESEALPRHPLAKASSRSKDGRESPCCLRRIPSLGQASWSEYCFRRRQLHCDLLYWLLGQTESALSAASHDDCWRQQWARMTDEEKILEDSTRISRWKRRLGRARPHTRSMTRQSRRNAGKFTAAMGGLVTRVHAKDAGMRAARGSLAHPDSSRRCGGTDWAGRNGRLETHKGDQIRGSGLGRASWGLLGGSAGTLPLISPSSIVLRLRHPVPRCTMTRLLL